MLHEGPCKNTIIWYIIGKIVSSTQLGHELADPSFESFTVRKSSAGSLPLSLYSFDSSLFTYRWELFGLSLLVSWSVDALLRVRSGLEAESVIARLISVSQPTWSSSRRRDSRHSVAGALLINARDISHCAFTWTFAMCEIGSCASSA